MRHRYMAILTAGLFILVAALFILVCHLSRKQHLTNIQSVRDGYKETLTRESSSLRTKLKTIESDTLSAFDSPGFSFELSRTNRLFIWNQGTYIPAGIAELPPQGEVAPDTAREALSDGLIRSRSGDSARAREQLLKAARIQIRTAEELNVRTSALAELFKMAGSRDSGLLFSIFHALFQYPAVKLSDEQIRKMEDSLRALRPDYDILKEQNTSLWKTAAEISLVTSNRPGPLRTVCGENILTVNSKGQSCLIPVEALRDDSSNAVVRITATDPGDKAAVVYQMRYPALYLWIAAAEFETRKNSAERAYLMTKVLLGIMLAVITVVGFGFVTVLHRLHEMAALKSSFLSTVSHELRTPMALIRLYAESLSSGSTPPATKANYTQAIMAETDRLTALVNNVLDFTRLEKDTMTLNIRETDVSKVCGEALDSFSFRMEKENITLARHIEPGLKAMIDPLALTQVMFNLIDNAIKYSHDNNKKIEVELAQDGDRIRLRVRDNGIGVPYSLKQRMFMPFVRGEDDRVTAQRGSGIGLSIVSRLLERMHCSIKCLDNLPEGTIFEITMITKDSHKAAEGLQS